MTLSFCSLPLPFQQQVAATTNPDPSGLDQTGQWNGESTGKVSAGGRADRALLGNRSGQRLGHFVLQEPLGVGGMGAVYRALDSSLQRYVAVKVMREGNGDSNDSGIDQQTERLRREAVAQARLNHPRVVTIYYVGREGEEPFLAMELLPGPTLQQRLTMGPLPYNEVIQFALQTTEALEAADKSGLVHGDIKPSNLLMSGPGSIKLSDFGLARRSGTSDGHGVSGTPNYLAPELLDGAPPDRRTDMYALGVTLFELAFGRRPYQLAGSSLEQRLLAHRTAEIDFPDRWPEEVPEMFRGVLEKLLAKKPEDRFASYHQLQAALLEVAPIGSTSAGRVARGIAWIVDLSLLGLLQAPFLLPNLILRVADSQDGNDWLAEQTGGMVPLLLAIWLTGVLSIFGSVAVPALALWWDLRRWRTPGRYLMQLRVVDKHGLPPPRRVLILRNILRYFTYWSGILLALPVTLGFVWFEVIGDLAGWLWMLVDSVFVVLPSRTTLHDRICRTHVVLDEQVTAQRLNYIGTPFVPKRRAKVSSGVSSVRPKVS
jgi:serine/threonine protein kinase